MNNNIAKEKALKQPKVFYLASIVTMFERASFYIYCALFVLYLKAVFAFSDSEAFLLFGVFNALGFVLPAITGYTADNVFGIRRTLIAGLLLEAIGLIIAAFPSANAMYLGTAFIAVGVSLFRIAPSNLLGRSYKDNDPRTDSGFTLFYMYINIGAFLSMIIAESLQVNFGWHTPFLVGAMGIFVSLICYYCLKDGAKECDVPVGYQKMSFNFIVNLIFTLLVAVVACMFIMKYSQISNKLFLLSGLLIALYLGYLAYKSSKKDRMAMLACILLTFMGIAHGILYFQSFTSMELFCQRSVNHYLWFLPVNTTGYMALNSLWIIALSPLISMFYNYLVKHKGSDIPLTTKFPLGIFIVTLTFFVLQFSTMFYNSEFKISGWWVVLAFFLYSLGELFISALGVSMVVKIAPRSMYGLMIGVWNLGVGFSAIWSGMLAGLSEIPSYITDKEIILSIYSSAFGKLGLIGLALSLISFMIAPYIKKIANL